MGVKEDCSARDTCVTTPLENPECGSCLFNCGQKCVYEMTEYKEWTCSDSQCISTIASMVDLDHDYVDDRCDSCVDADFDKVCDDVDTCLGVYNPTNVDTDNDGVGNACDYDRDNDGYNADVDCNDWNAKINPGAAEVEGDNIDNDCNPLTTDRPERIRAQDILMSVKVMNEDTALREGELMVAVYLKNAGDKRAKDLKVQATILDEFITDQTVVPTLDAGKTTRVVFYLPIDKLGPDDYYVKSTVNVETVKKSQYAAARLY